MIKQLVGTLGIAVLCVSGGESAPAQGQGRGRGQSSQPAAPATVTVVVQFGAHDRDLIAAYFAQPASGLPPGLAKRHDGLPPGLEKQLQRNGTLPPGLQKRLQRFPTALDRQLTPLPAGYVRGVIGSHIVIYKSGTNMIVDVVLNIAK
jgi:hypothetical protein